MRTGKTKNLGVIGCPIEHSLSPIIQNAAIEKAGLDYNYIALHVAPENLAAAVNGLRALEFRGVNVTIPHKTAIMEHLDEIDAKAKLIGAVNTVVNDNGKLTGYNTDYIGFIRGLKNRGFDFKNKNVAVFGAGGAARAVIVGLFSESVSNITLGVRNKNKGEKAAADFAQLGNITAADYNEDAWTKAIATADLIVNTTPLGMTPRVDECVPIDYSIVKPSAYFYDIIYTPAETKFLRQARESGHATLNGESMLALQGAASLRLWTGAEVDEALMEKVLHDYLNQQ